nr:S-layer homology domain-containing protein [uncultured Romboutsia sp.]
MKNKKSIAMAMAAVSSFGAVAPAFANEVAPLVLTDTTVDYRLANGETLVKTEDGTKVRVVKGRDSLYNDNFTPNDKSDDTLKTEFKDAKILVSKNTNDKDDTNDLYVLVKKAPSTSNITMEKAKLDVMIAEIKDYKAKGATVTVGTPTKARIEEDKTNQTYKFKDSEIIVTVTPKGEVAKQYTFNGIPGVEGETPADENPFTQLVGKVNVKVADEKHLTNDEKAAYYNLNKFKFVAEQNKDKFDFVKEQDDNNNKNLNVKVYKKGAKQEKKNIKFTMIIENFGKLEKELVINMATTNDFGSHWAKEQIVEAMLQGQVDVAENFRPQDGITRAEFAKIACTVFAEKISDGKNEPFHDVTTSDWYHKYVAALYNTKTEDGVSVIQGDGENFRPNDKITRQEVAVIVAKLVSNKSQETTIPVNGTNVDKVVETNFKDTKSIASWADQSVKYLSETKDKDGKFIVQGDGGYFNPTQNITRAEALVMVQRAASAPKATPLN